MYLAPSVVPLVKIFTPLHPQTEQTVLAMRLMEYEQQFLSRAPPPPEHREQRSPPPATNAVADPVQQPAWGGRIYPGPRPHASADGAPYKGASPVVMVCVSGTTRAEHRSPPAAAAASSAGAGFQVASGVGHEGGAVAGEQGARDATPSLAAMVPVQHMRLTDIPRPRQQQNQNNNHNHHHNHNHNQQIKQSWSSPFMPPLSEVPMPPPHTDLGRAGGGTVVGSELRPPGEGRGVGNVAVPAVAGPAASIGQGATGTAEGKGAVGVTKCCFLKKTVAKTRAPYRCG